MRNLSSHVERLARVAGSDWKDVIRSCIVEIKPLDTEEQADMVKYFLSSESRRLTDSQYKVLKLSLNFQR
jgi:hypothetical protein